MLYGQQTQNQAEQIGKKKVMLIIPQRIGPVGLPQEGAEFFLTGATFPFQGGLEDVASAADFTGEMGSAAAACLSKVTFLSLGAEGAAKE